MCAWRAFGRNHRGPAFAAAFAHGRCNATFLCSWGPVSRLTALDAPPARHCLRIWNGMKMPASKEGWPDFGSLGTQGSSRCFQTGSREVAKHPCDGTGPRANKIPKHESSSITTKNQRARKPYEVRTVDDRPTTKTSRTHKNLIAREFEADEICLRDNSARLLLASRAGPPTSGFFSARRKKKTTDESTPNAS